MSLPAYNLVFCRQGEAVGMARRYDVVVIGAGAAGMMCAAVAGQRGKRVLLVDHAAKLAEKIRISGGGRCNFTNINAGWQNFLSENPHFCRSALSRYTAAGFPDTGEKTSHRATTKSTGASCSATTRRNRSSAC